jgi:large subunit ribosomal protein L9
MDLILLERISKLGDLGDKVSVKPGYARNYLIPQGKALLANGANLAEFEARRTEFEQNQSDKLIYAQTRATKLPNQSVVIARKVAIEDKLFGSVNAHDISEAANLIGIELSKHEVRLPNGPLRQLGEYSIDVHLHADVDSVLKVHILNEDNA